MTTVRIFPSRLLSVVGGLALLTAVLTACGAGPRPTATLAPVASRPPGTTLPAGAIPSTVAGAPKSYSAPPPMAIDQNKTYTALIKTSMGDITVELNAKDAPLTVNNFVFLARDKFYDGLVFHRIIKNFMIQGGDPLGTGTGGPGYKFADEPVKTAYEVGSIAMANSGANTNGSQFFICEGQQCVTLPKQYNLFGKVTDGIDVVHKIAAVQTGAQDRPVQPVTITSVTITEK
jgi:cyclophilin family peptidyl-prolyl cis-trans isomerase